VIAGGTSARLVSVNVGRARPQAGAALGLSAIDKRPVTGPVAVRAPGPKGVGGSGLAGDRIVDLHHHGGDHQAVYAYATEDLAAWAALLGRPLAPGSFGENLSTAGLDVTGTRLGEQWRVGTALLQVTAARIPCGTFAAWLGEQRWQRRFTERGAPGAYLQVLQPGSLEAGDPVTVEHRPAHEVTIGVAFRAITTEPELLPQLLTAGDALHPELHAKVLRRLRCARADA
jgi:MOSC domain-containing protein YiiM